MNEEMNYIRSVLLDLESKEPRTLELVGAFISNLPLGESEKYNIWSEWVSHTTTDDLDGFYDLSKSLPTVTLEDLEEAAADAVEASISDTDSSLQSFEVTEYNFTTPKAVAKQFVAMYKKPLKYVADLDIWLEWSASHWLPVEEVYLTNVLANATDRIFKKHQKIDEYEPKDLRAFSRTYNKVAGLKEVLKTVKAQNEVEVLSKDLDNDPNIIGCLNGAVDLSTGLLTISDYNQYLTKSTGLRYNRNATCDTWIKTVNDVFYDDAEMVSFFKTLIGYSILGNPKEDLLVIPYGSGANGKSTIFNTIADVFGDYGKSTAFSTFTASATGSQHREDLVRLQGSRFVYTSEPDAFGALKEGLIKTITGGDVLTVRTAYARKSVEISPKWVTFIPTNHKPMIRGADDGIWRRMLFIPFKRNFTLEPDLLDIHLSDKLAEEHEGILRWIIEGALDYQQNGLVIPEELIKDKNDYREESDIVRTWIESECILEGSDSNQNLWLSFSKFVKDRGYDTDIKSSQKLSNNINGRGFERARFNKGVRGFSGIKVKD